MTTLRRHSPRASSPRSEARSRSSPRIGIDLARVATASPVIGTVVSGAAILVLIGVVTIVVIVTGGAPNPLAHLYYIPILYAAVRHGRIGALIASVVAGLAAGPWMPAPHTASGEQPVTDWTVRIAIFIVVGVIAAWLARQDPRPIELILRDMVLGQGVRAAVTQHRVRVHYQPLVELYEGRVVGVEALCRWNDNRGRPISPGVFIPAAEQTRAIIPLGREVLRIATAQAERFAEAQGQGLILSVNVSAVQLSHAGFLGELASLVRDASDRHYQLCIEITETAIVSDPETAQRTLSAAKHMGVIIAIDDFGTGQSSLAYLAGFPVDIIKIDQSFVATVESDTTSRALVSAVVRIATSLGATTIAEGIERPGQLRALRELGCDLGQGYYLGRPTDASDVDWSQRTLA